MSVTAPPGAGGGQVVGLDVGDAATKIVVDGRQLPPLPTAVAHDPLGRHVGQAALGRRDAPATRVAAHLLRPDAFGAGGPLEQFLDEVMAPAALARAAEPGDPGRGPAAPAAPVTRIVLAGPGGPTAPALADHVTRVVARRGGAASVRVVPAAVCTAAALAVPAAGTGGDAAPPVVHLVCDIGARTVTAALCARQGRTVRLLDVATAASAGTSGPVHAFTDALARALLTTHPGLDPRAALVAVEDEQQRRHRRAELVVNLAEVLERYRATPVYFPLPAGAASSPIPVITAADVLAALPLLVRAAQATVRDVLSRRREDLPCLDLVLTGGLSGLEPLARAVSLAVAPVPVTRRHRLDIAAAARGAWAIGASQVAVEDRCRHALRMRLHQVRDGRLGEVHIPLTEPGRPHPQWTRRDDGQELLVRVRPDELDPATTLQARIDGQGPWRDVPVPGLADVPAGLYRVGLFPGRHELGALVLASSTGQLVNLSLDTPDASGEPSREQHP